MVDMKMVGEIETPESIDGHPRRDLVDLGHVDEVLHLRQLREGEVV
jgi:hypothetical protein